MPIFLSLRASFEINANKDLFFEYLFFCYSYIQIPNGEVVVELFLSLFRIITLELRPTSFDIQALKWSSVQLAAAAFEQTNQYCTSYSSKVQRVRPSIFWLQIADISRLILTYFEYDTHKSIISVPLFLSKNCVQKNTPFLEKPYSSSYIFFSVVHTQTNPIVYFQADIQSIFQKNKCQASMDHVLAIHSQRYSGHLRKQNFACLFEKNKLTGIVL